MSRRRPLLLFPCLLFLTACQSSAQDLIKSDETVTFFPTYGIRCEAGWRVWVHGWIYELERDSLLRAGVIKALGVAADDSEEAIFRERALYFMADNERGKRLNVHLGETTILGPETPPNGHFQFSLELPPRPAGDVEVRSDPAEDGAIYRGRAHLLEPEGLSVISDIDDTIKISQVTDKEELIANTFLREFRAAPGMAALFRAWAKRGASFHFVSSSPWQLYPVLERFRASAGFPPATFHLKSFRAKDSTFWNLFKKGTETKPLQIRPLLTAFPRRRFYLVGDSGEQDPEVYGEFARDPTFGPQIEHIYIRNVTGEAADSARMQQAFRELAPERWSLFEDPAEVFRKE